MGQSVSGNGDVDYGRLRINTFPKVPKLANMAQIRDRMAEIGAAPKNPWDAALTQGLLQLEVLIKSVEPDENRLELEREYETWLYSLFPQVFTRQGARIPFAQHHHSYWSHVWSWQPGVRPRPVVLVLARGGGKSTNAELTPVACGARGVRRYFLYVSATQELADKHVGSIGAMLESRKFAEVYPLMSERRLNKYGSSRGWRRNRLSTAQGLTVDAIGLDVATRGIKMDIDRPDGIIFDDVDDRKDDQAAVQKKIETITYTILPAGSPDCGIAFVQNVIHHNSICAQLSGVSSEVADFMQDRLVIGPVPALEGFSWRTEHTIDEQGRKRPRYVIVSGTPTWEGQSLASCQELLDTIAIKAFRAEAQHEDIQQEGGLFDSVEFQHVEEDQVPWGEIKRTTVWLDPAITSTNKSDSHGIQCDGLAESGAIYRLYSWEGISEPVESIKRGIVIALAFGSHTVGIETDQGGDLWENAYKDAWRELTDDTGRAEEIAAQLGLVSRFPVGVDQALSTTRRPQFQSEKAGSVGSKAHRANLMLADYNEGNIFHVLNGTHTPLEKALRRYLKQKPYDLVDSAFWSWYDLRGGRKGVERLGAIAQAIAKGSPWSTGRARTPESRAEHYAQQQKDKLEKSLVPHRAVLVARSAPHIRPRRRRY